MSENSATPETTSPTPPPPAGQPYGMNQPYVAKRVKKRKGVRVWVVVLLVILGVLVGTLVGNNVRANPYLTFQDSIGVIDLDGTIGQDDGANTPEGAPCSAAKRRKRSIHQSGRSSREFRWRCRGSW